MYSSDPIGNVFGMWAAELGIGCIVFRLFLAFLLGGLIGYERSTKRHVAGLRTFILVCVTSSVAILIDTYAMKMYNLEFNLVLSGAVIISLGFISTYSILMSSKNQIKGLTTAVALWSVSLIGMAIGIGFYTIAFTGFLIIYFCLTVLPKLERDLKDKSNHFEIHLELTDRKKLQDFVNVIRELGMVIDDIEFNSAYLNSGLSVYTVSLSIYNNTLKQYKKHSEIITALKSLEYVSYIEEIL